MLGGCFDIECTYVNSSLNLFKSKVGIVWEVECYI